MDAKTSPFYLPLCFLVLKRMGKKNSFFYHSLLMEKAATFKRFETLLIQSFR